MYQFLIVKFSRTNVVRVRVGCDNFSGNQAVFAETIDRLVMFAFEEQ